MLSTDFAKMTMHSAKGKHFDIVELCMTVHDSKNPA